MEHMLIACKSVGVFLSNNVAVLFIEIAFRLLEEYIIM